MSVTAWLQQQSDRTWARQGDFDHLDILGHSAACAAQMGGAQYLQAEGDPLLMLIDSQLGVCGHAN